MITTTLLGSNLPVMQSQLLMQEAGIVHFCTLRGGNESPYSNINMCDYTGDDPRHVASSRQMFADCLGISTDRMWFPRQVHGTKVLSVDSSMPSGQEADAVITTERHLLIGVSTADCVPVLLFDRRNSVVAAVHAGWRGTIGNIVERTLEKMIVDYDSSPKDIIATIGPSISPEAFEVGDEVAEQFDNEGYTACISHIYPKTHIDLWKVNTQQLLSAGIKAENIDCSPICTYQNIEILFSARRLGIKSGRIISGIMLK